MTTKTAEKVVSQILSEDMLSLAQAQRELIPILGKRLDKTSLYRWCLRGVGGVRLDHVRLGIQLFTSKQALTRFIVARTAASTK